MVHNYCLQVQSMQHATEKKTENWTGTEWLGLDQWLWLLVFKGPVWSSFLANFDRLQPQPVANYGKTKENQSGLQKTSPNHIKWKFCCNLFEPTKTGIFAIFYT